MNITDLRTANIMQLWLFNTCNFRCGYCGLVPTGDVERLDQLDPYKDPSYIERMLRFFRSHRPEGRQWAVHMTGGEPLLMPNIDAFVCGLGQAGDKAMIQSNFSIPVDRVLSKEAIRHVAFMQASFHPDWHLGTFAEETFFDNVRRAKDLGIPVCVRFVGAPQVLHLLPQLERRCQEVGVGFYPTTLFNPDYPAAYTAAERETLSEFMVGYSTLIQLDGGLHVGNRQCEAAGRLFAARFYENFDISPCISTGSPVIGNILNNELYPQPGYKPCFKKDGICSCDAHFQFAIIEGVDDWDDYQHILEGRGIKRKDSYRQWCDENHILTQDKVFVGQGTVFTSEDILRDPRRRLLGQRRRQKESDRISLLTWLRQKFRRQ